MTLDLGENQGIPYIVFEYLNPRTLRQRLNESTPDIEEILRISIGLVDAIGAAHRHGVIHRDIKPSNILLDESGNPKLVDFGLAILSTVDSDTRTAGIVGTLGYMSPEQARGEEIDERSDLFSLGVVIYEMITGMNPFRRDSEVSSLHALINEEPGSIRRHRGDVPTRLDDIVMALLQKDASSRYQCAEHLRDDLVACRQPASLDGPLRTGPCVAENRLAVMPFDNLASEDTASRVGEMIAHLLITGLSDIRGVSVVSGQRLYDLLSLEGRQETRKIDRSMATRLARRAEARWMLLGSIFSQTPLVLTTQLVDINSGLLVKGHRFALAAEATIFDAADQVLARLQTDLSDRGGGQMGGPVPITSLTTHSADALRHYLLGFEWQARWNEEGAREEYEQAVACDPTFAMAYYGLATIPVPNRMALIEKAESLAERATYRERCYIRAMRLRLQGDRQASMAVLKELLERHSDEKLAYHWIGVHHHFLGNFEEAIKYLRKAIELDPLYFPAYNQLVYTLNRAGQFEESMIVANQYIQLSPDEPNPYDSRAEVLGFNGRLEAALASYREALARTPLLPPSLMRAGVLYVLKQDYDSARELFDRLPALVSRSPWIDPHVYYVTIPLRQGKWRKALAYLDCGIAEDLPHEVRRLHVAYKRELKAITYLEMGLNADALREMDMAMPSFGTQIWYYSGMHMHILHAWLLARNGHISEALKKVESEVGHSDAIEPVLRMRYLLTRGLVYYEAGDLDRAVALLEEADETKPRWLSTEHFVLQGMLARSNLRLGRLDRAVELFESSMHVFAESRAWLMLLDVKNHYYLGLAYEQSGWATKAAEQYRTFLETWKDAEDGFPEIEDAKVRLAKLP